MSRILKTQPKLWYKKTVEAARCCDHVIVTLYITTSLPVRINEFYQCAPRVSFIEANSENRSFNTVLESANNEKAPIRIRGYNDELRR